jgi:hypothetical protein
MEKDEKRIVKDVHEYLANYLEERKNKELEDEELEHIFDTLIENYGIAKDVVSRKEEETKELFDKLDKKRISESKNMKIKQLFRGGNSNLRREPEEDRVAVTLEGQHLIRTDEKEDKTDSSIKNDDKNSRTNVLERHEKSCDNFSFELGDLKDVKCQDLFTNFTFYDENGVPL